MRARKIFLAALALTGIACVAAGPARALPSGMAYELVSPQTKNGFDVAPFGGAVRVAADGDSVAYQSGAFADPPVPSAPFTSASQYLAARGAGGWRTRVLTPALDGQPPSSPITNTSGFFGYFTPDLGAALFGSGGPELLSSAPAGYFNLYVRDNLTDSYGLVTTATPPVPVSSAYQYNPVPFGASADLSHIVFRMRTGLLPGDPGSGGIYEWANGTLRFASIFPDDSPVTIPDLSGGDNGQKTVDNAVSKDGSRIVFTTGGDDGPNPLGIYVREDGVRTVYVSESQRTPPDPVIQSANFLYATPDGSRVFFSSRGRLTDSSTAGPSSDQKDLYRYDLDSGDLLDLSVTSHAGGGQVSGIAGVSASGEDAYFVALGIIDGLGVDGQPNLYHWHDDGTETGEIGLIGTLTSPWDDGAWALQTAIRTTRLSSDGELLAFSSVSKLTAYDNHGRREIYIYDANTHELKCASCRPGGEPPQGEAEISIFNPALSFNEDFKPRNFTSSGERFFFNTSDGLLPEDGNGRIDVYAYDIDDQSLSLVSSGRSSDDSRFADASPDGENVFFTTRERLVGVDRDDNLDLYVARAGGGIASQNPPPPSPPCVGASCRDAIPPSPSFADPATLSVRGRGNAASGRQMAGGRCERLRRRSRATRRQAKRLARRSAKAQRRSQAVRTRRKARRLQKKSRKLNRKARICKRNVRGARK